MVETRAQPNYSQVKFKGVVGKLREIKHAGEDDACGATWYTIEVYSEALGIHIDEDTDLDKELEPLEIEINADR